MWKKIYDKQFLIKRQDIGRSLRGFWQEGRSGQGFRKACEDVRLRMALLAFFAFAWWGILYPEICFTEDTYQQVVVKDGEVRTVNEADGRGILDAEGDEIVIGSRLLEWLEEMKWFRHGG